MKEIKLDDGTPAVLTEAGKETEKLAPYQMVVNGRRFTCQDNTEKTFCSYLEAIQEPELEVTVLYKIEVQLPYDLRKRKVKGRKRLSAEIDGETKSKNFNCTLKTTRDHARRIYQDKKYQFEELARILASVIAGARHEAV